MHCKTCTDSQTCQTCDAGYGLSHSLCVICPSGTYLSNDQICKDFSSTLQETLKNSQLLNSAATQATNLISKGRVISLSAMVGGKIFSQIKYLNISYSGELQIALLTWLPSFVSLGLTPDMPNSFTDKIPERHVPYVFEKYQVSSSFLINFWENLGIIIFAAFLWIVFKSIECFKSPKPNHRLATITRKARVMIQNFLIAALYGVYGDLILFSIIEYRTLVFGWNLSLLSFLISILLLGVMFASFYYQIKILLKYQRIKKSDSVALDAFKKNYEGSQVFFKDFKDYSFSPQLFLFFLIGRDSIFSLLLATMFEYPLAQTTIMTILDCLMIVYLFVKRPFESKFDFIQQLFFEFIGLVVNVTVFINAIFDAGKYQTLQGRTNVGKLVIIANMIFNFVTAVFMIIVIGQTLVDFYKEQQQKRAKLLKALGIHSRLQSLQPLETSQASLRKDNMMNPDQSLIQESIMSNTNNNLDTIPFQQESFDQNLLSHPQRFPKRNRPLRPSLQSQNIASSLESQEFHHNVENVNQRNPPRRNLRRRPDDQRIFEKSSEATISSNLPQETRPRR